MAWIGSPMTPGVPQYQLFLGEMGETGVKWKKLVVQLFEFFLLPNCSLVFPDTDKSKKVSLTPTGGGEILVGRN